MKAGTWGGRSSTLLDKLKNTMLSWPPQHGWRRVWQKDGMAMPFPGAKGEKAREFETPMKGRERISHF